LKEDKKESTKAEIYEFPLKPTLICTNCDSNDFHLVVNKTHVWDSIVGTICIGCGGFIGWEDGFNIKR